MRAIFVGPRRGIFGRGKIATVRAVSAAPTATSTAPARSTAAAIAAIATAAARIAMGALRRPTVSGTGSRRGRITRRFRRLGCLRAVGLMSRAGLAGKNNNVICGRRGGGRLGGGRRGFQRSKISWRSLRGFGGSLQVRGRGRLRRGLLSFDSRLDRCRNVVVVFQIFQEIADVEEGVAVEADFYERGLHSRENSGDATFVDTSD